MQLIGLLFFNFSDPSRQMSESIYTQHILNCAKILHPGNLSEGRAGGAPVIPNPRRRGPQGYKQPAHLRRAPFFP